MKVVITRPEEEVVVELAGTMTIGRGEGNGLVIRDQKVSREHAVIHRQRDGTFTLIDVGSLNGTYLKGVRVVLPVRLRPGDVIEIGASNLRLVAEDDERCGPDEAPASQEATSTIVNLEVREVTVLVADVRGYTTLSERLPVEHLSQLMGLWFRAVTDLVQQHHGVIDKFMGDAVMAVWVANPEQPAASVERAVASAVAVSRHSAAVTRDLPWWPMHEPFRTGIGLNTGPAVMGTLGAAARRDYTVAGDTVNVAFRIEPLTKTFPYRILASETTVHHVRDRFPFVEIGAVELRGRTKSVLVYGLEPDAASPGDRWELAAPSR
jgi:adenylate cyclase